MRPLLFVTGMPGLGMGVNWAGMGGRLKHRDCDWLVTWGFV